MRNRSEHAANVSLAIGARIPSPYVVRYYTPAQRRERERQWAARWLGAQVAVGVVILGACAILSACGFH